MSERTLEGCHVLIVEDEYMLAEELSLALNDAGAVVVGPAAALKDALSLIKSGEKVDAALIDVNLRGESAYAAADLLLDRQIPFVFTTGYDPRIIPEKYRQIPTCEKPVNLARVTSAIGRLVSS